jgi:signal transduction histidine kinase
MNRLKFRPFSENTWEHLAPYTVPIAVTCIAVIAVLGAIILLTVSVYQQIDIGTELLGINLSDQTRTFVQLQRETLRMLVDVTKPIAEFDAIASQTQYEILESRINHMNRAAIEAVVPPIVAENATTLNDMWGNISPNIGAWLANPDDEALRNQITTQLIEFERLANSTEIEFNRSRTFTLTEFANISRQIPISFGFATIAMIAMLIAVLFGVYRYVRQINEAEAARQASQQKDQFLAVMSHELRTPLNAIIGFLGILKMSGNLPEKELHMVDRSRANAERLLMLIDDILDISKIASGHFEIHMEDIAPRDLFVRWQSQTDVLASQKGIDFKVDLDPTLPERLNADSDVLSKIVTNLLSNAFKFTSDGIVNLHSYATEDSWVIEVTDTGIGIPQDKHEEIFESFRQVDGSTRRAYGGTGLGLSIVKQLTQLLNGQIVLKSELGKGSSFTVILPIVTSIRSQENSSETAVPDTSNTSSIEELDNAYSK